MRKKFFRNKSQVWVETAIYTLIGLTIIAIVMSIATPQIEKMKEKAIISQTLEAMNNLDNEIIKVSQVNGNLKVVGFKITKGELRINSTGNKLTFVLENTKLKFSEVGKEVKEGNIYFLTEEYGKNYNVYIELRYNNTLDITFNGEEVNRVLHGGGGTYKIAIENVGDQSFKDKVHLDIRVI
jgi:type II secretory pathway pseudopilin PulG